MSKRPAASSSTSRSSKKAKVATGQSNLDRFFSGSPQKPPPSVDNVTQASFKGQPKAEEDSQNGAIADRDMAEALAKEDGLDLATIQKMEREWKETTRGRITIDVDSDSDDVHSPTSSQPVPGKMKVVVPSKPASSPGLRITKKSELTHVEASTSLPTYQPLSVDPLVYDIDQEPWSQGNVAPYSFLSHALSTLSETRSRILIINTLTNALRTLSRYDPPSLLPALYLLSNSLSPPYIPIELGLGPSIISKAIQQVSGLTPAALRRLYNQSGDPGDVAFEAKSNLRTLIPHPPLLVTGVFKTLLKIAHSKGQGAAKSKQSLVEKLLVSAKGEETRFLTRTLSMNLRVGAVRTSILTALARAMALTPPSDLKIPVPFDSSLYVPPQLVNEVDLGPCAKGSKKPTHPDKARIEIVEIYSRVESLMKRVFVQHPNYDHIVEALLISGLDGLASQVRLSVGIPLHPTLGSPLRSLEEVYETLGDLAFAAEYKYDGQRAQIHCNKAAAEGTVAVQIFSRHLENMTTKYPDVIALMNEVFSDNPALTSFIIDSEIVAIDPSDGSLKTFQELSNRPRKDVQLSEVKVAVAVFAFDLMYLNDKVLLEEPFRTRRSLLRSSLPSFTSQQRGSARFDHVQSCESEDGKEAIEEFWLKAVESRCEGLMVKLLDSGEVPVDDENPKKSKGRRKPLPATYEPDKRTSAWLKLKKDYVTSLGDSLDLVPIGGWHGNGRKAQWWSPVLLALHDRGSGRLVAVCKCMSGFTDVFYKAMRERYAENSDACSRQNLWDVDPGGLRPSVYFKPSEVWEIRGADVTLSPVSVAALGLVSDVRGLSLRFPRFIRVRDDKNPEQASDSEFLANMYSGQQGKPKNTSCKDVDEGDLIDNMSESEGLEDNDIDSEA